MIKDLIGTGMLKRIQEAQMMKTLEGAIIL